MNPKYLKLDLDQPYTVALRYPSPTIVKGFNGPECRWMLMNGQAMYTPLDLKAQIEAFKPGQQFTVQKIKAGCEIQWKIARSANAVSPQPTPGLPGERQHKQPAAQILDQQESLDSQPYEAPSSRLEDALKIAVSAAATAEKHGAAIGYQLRFQSQDIRAMAISILIGMDRRAA